MSTVLGRGATNEKAAKAVLDLINDLGVSRRRFADLIGMSPSTLALFLRDCSAEGAGHARGPRFSTMQPLLDCDIPEFVRNALLDSLYYEERVVKPALMKTKRAAVQNSIYNRTQTKRHFIGQYEDDADEAVWRRS